MVKVSRPDPAADSGIDTNVFHDGIRHCADEMEDAEAFGVTVSAHAAANALVECFAEAGMPRSADFIEQLGTIIDGHARIPELLGALLATHRFLTGLIASDQIPTVEMGVSPAMCERIERNRLRVRRALEHVAARIEGVLGLVRDDAQRLVIPWT